MWRSCVGGVLCLALYACETTPEPVELTPAEFTQVVSEAKGRWHPWLTIQTYTETLDTATLSDAQRARLLVERGAARREAQINLPGAISDFTQAMTLNAEPATTEQAEAALGAAEGEFEEVRARLGGVQTLQAWFEDMVASGQIAEGVERYKTSGLAPEPDDARLLEAAGYLCKDEAEGDQDWELGYELEYLENLEWCETATVS